MRTIANFIDAGHLDKLGRLFGVAVHVKQLAQRMAEACILRGTYYYDCLPYRGQQPTAEELGQYERKHRFLTTLSYQPNVEVRLGRLAFRGVAADGTRVLQQKRVDVAVGTDLLVAACKGLITDAALLAGDEDFLPAIERAREEGVRVHLYHGPSATRALVKACDSHCCIDEAFLHSVQWQPRRQAC